MRGDIDIERLVDQHYAALFRFAASLSANGADAGDLVQETFYLLAAKGHQVTDTTKVKSWLFTTLYRLFLSGRRRVVRFSHEPLDESADELPTIPAEPPTQLDWATLAQDLARVDLTFRAPVILFYLEDHSYQEIAGILEIPLGTVKSRIARGIAQLQKLLLEPRSRAARAEGIRP